MILAISKTTLSLTVGRSIVSFAQRTINPEGASDPKRTRQGLLAMAVPKPPTRRGAEFGTQNLHHTYIENIFSVYYRRDYKLFFISFFSDKSGVKKALT